MPINHYRSQARYYKNLLIITRDKACLHLENKNDEAFWKPIFKHFFPSDTFHFIPHSKSESNNDTSGCEQCLKFRPYLDEKFLICIDSDYRYLHQETDIDINHFIFQTYTYSFENHLCHEKGFNNTCKLVTNGYENTAYDYASFIKRFSNIIYDLFIWHVALCKSNPPEYPKDAFTALLNVGSLQANKQEKYLEELEIRTNEKLNSLQQSKPHFDLDAEKQLYSGMGVTEDNVYLYIRGHCLFTLYNKILDDTCSTILEHEKQKLVGNGAEISSLFSKRKKVENVFIENIFFGQYPEIEKIEEDMKIYQTM